MTYDKINFQEGKNLAIYLATYIQKAKKCDDENTLKGSYLGQITSGKRVGAQNRKRQNWDIKFPKPRNNWLRLNMLKATEAERKIR